MVTATVTRLQPGQALEAAGYIRVSRKVQAEGHSPGIQREAIKRLARQEGYILSDDMIKEDHERGSKLTRKGYQQIIEAVRDGQIHAVASSTTSCPGGRLPVPSQAGWIRL